MKRDIRVVPPLISVVKGLTRLGHDVDLFTYYCSPETLAGADIQRLRVETVSEDPYPTGGLLQRASATWRTRRSLKEFLRHSNGYDYYWLGTCDFPGFIRMARGADPHAAIIFHFHELEPDRFKYCRRADYVVVPEVNRAWLTYFWAGLHHRPLVLPNCPLEHPRRVREHVDETVRLLCETGKRIVLYHGYVDTKKRCLPELIRAVALIPRRYVLAIMPSLPIDRDTQQELEAEINANRVKDRVVFLQTRAAPGHLKVVGKAYVGIGLYRPTSLNQIYCAPNRTYELAGFGVPVILPDYPAISQLAVSYPGILTCDPQCPDSIAKAIHHLDNEEAYQAASAGATRFFAEQGNYLEHLDGLLHAIEALRDPTPRR